MSTVTRRTRLWNEDPRCRRCFEVTMLPEDLALRYGGTPGDQKWLKEVPRDQLERMATLQHMRSRLNPFRGSDNKESTTLYCWKCNQLDSAEEIARHYGRNAGESKVKCDGCEHPKGDRRRICPCKSNLCVSCQRKIRHMLHRARSLRGRLRRLSWHLSTN